MPETGRQEECRPQAHWLIEKFTRERIDAQHRENADERRRHSQRLSRVAQQVHEERLQIDKQPFAAEVLGIKDEKPVFFNVLQRIAAIHRLIDAKRRRKR